MASAAHAELTMTLDEYLEFEEAEGVRYEYVGGTLYAMTGGTLRHNRVAQSLSMTIGPLARRDGCETYSENAKLIVNDSLVYYPDYMVCCETDDEELRFVRSPCLVVEILSPSTATIDRREKFVAYLSIPTLLVYLIVDPVDNVAIAHRRSATSDRWTQVTLSATGSMELACPAMTLAMADVFA